MTVYSSDVYFPAWRANNGSTLTPTTDVRPTDFGVQLLDEFKNYARITYNFDDLLLPFFVDSAISMIEQQLELCILPRSFLWQVDEGFENYEFFEVPLRNTKTAGEIYDFTPERAKVIIPTPTSFPVTLVCGFDTADIIPHDLRLAIFQVASALEMNRTLTESSGISVPKNIFARYGVMRC